MQMLLLDVAISVSYRPPLATTLGWVCGSDGMTARPGGGVEQVLAITRVPVLLAGERRPGFWLESAGENAEFSKTIVRVLEEYFCTNIFRIIVFNMQYIC